MVFIKNSLNSGKSENIIPGLNALFEESLISR